MALLTLEECKDFLNISSTETTFDDNINALLPQLPERIYRICNSAFPANVQDDDLYILAEVQATFVASTSVITAKDENFASALFAANQDIFVTGSYLNDGFYVVNAVSSSTLTIQTSTVSARASLRDEASGATITFAVVAWPPGIKPLAASLVQFDYQDRGTWRDGENGAIGIYGYPKTLLRDFEFYTRVRYY